MKLIRWIACFPGAMFASFLGWALALKIFSGVASTYGGGLVRSGVGLAPVFISSVIPTVVFVMVGTLLSPSKGRKVVLVFFGLSLLFSAGGLQLLQFQDFSHVFWLAAAAGIVGGALIGLFASLPVQRLKGPNQPPEPTAPSGRGSS